MKWKVRHEVTVGLLTALFSDCYVVHAMESFTLTNNRTFIKKKSEFYVLQP